MIGGVDVIFPNRLQPPQSLEAAVRAIVQFWKRAVFQDGTTGRLFPGNASIPFADLHEILAYRDRPSFDLWERLGADPSNGDLMVHLLSFSTDLTAVVGDPDSRSSRALRRAIGDSLAN